VFCDSSWVAFNPKLLGPSGGTVVSLREALQTFLLERRIAVVATLVSDS
jgi:hypothetical protein